MHFPARGTQVLPAVEIFSGDSDSPSGVVQWLGVIGSKESAKLEGVAPADLAAIQAAWPGEADRLRRVGGAVWRITSVPKLVFARSTDAERPHRATDTPPHRPDSIESPSSQTNSNLFAAFAWCCAVSATAFLFVRLPQSTWPEQAGLLGAMLSFIALENFALGIGIYAAARLAWLIRRVWR
jgi:hypothetical protein